MYAVEHGHVGGLELSRRFYREAVQPLLNRHFGPLTHTAALIGTGSEVLGFDTERSTDHDWGPRLLLFLGAGDIERYGAAIDTMLAERLPATFLGFHTNLAPIGGGDTRHMTPADGPIRHGVVVAELRGWLSGHLGFDPFAGITPADWLATSSQAFAETPGASPRPCSPPSPTRPYVTCPSPAPSTSTPTAPTWSCTGRAAAA